MMEEKIYYQDENAKVTNLRITCNHITIPVDKIENVSVDLRVNTLTIAFICFLLSFATFFWGWKMAVPGLILIVMTFIWVYNVYRAYVELIVTVASKKVKLFNTGMGNRDYVYRIEDALNSAILDDQMERKLNGERGLPNFSPSETLKLRQMLIEYENNEKKGSEKKTPPQP